MTSHNDIMIELENLLSNSNQRKERYRRALEKIASSDDQCNPVFLKGIAEKSLNESEESIYNAFTELSNQRDKVKNLVTNIKKQYKLNKKEE